MEPGQCKGMVWGVCHGEVARKQRERRLRFASVGTLCRRAFCDVVPRA
jgi:hypothetical protein